MKRAFFMVTMLPALVFAQATKVGSDIVGAPGSKPRASLDARINRLDTNGDGMISRAEASGYPKLAKAFNRIDVNKDEQLSRDELMAFKEKAKAVRAAKKGNSQI
jgi:Ca2+-binding EF-hand superfamily protein